MKMDEKVTERLIAKCIGREYVTSQFESEESEMVRLAYREIVKVNRELFAKIPLPVVFTDDDAYSSAKEMRERVLKEGIIYIYTGWSGHPFLTQEENNIGRAVHDVIAHLVCGCPFSFRGELNAYYEQRKHYPQWVWNVLFAEIPAQTAGYYYAEGFNFHQRAIEAPLSWVTLVQGLEKDYSENAIFEWVNGNLRTRCSYVEVVA